MKDFKEMLKLVEDTNVMAKQVIENQRIINEYFELEDDLNIQVSNQNSASSGRETGITEQYVSEFIMKLGIPANIKGYRYIITAILLAVDDFDIMNKVTKELYPTVAKEYKTTPSRVERAIRHAIEVACDRGNFEMLDDLFGYSIDSNKGKPTNSEFIAGIATKLIYKN